MFHKATYVEDANATNESRTAAALGNLFVDAEIYVTETLESAIVNGQSFPKALLVQRYYAVRVTLTP